jgi:flagellar basal body-associated protein FliL
MIISWNMKRILFLAMLVVIGVAFVCAGAGLYFYEFSNGTSTAENTEACPPPKKLEPLPDIDALASRMKYDQDVKPKTRD